MAPKMIKKMGNAIKAEAKKIVKAEGKKLVKNVVAPAVKSAITKAPVPMSGTLGDLAAHGLVKITGSGDYVVKTNSLYNKGGVAENIPKFGKNGRGTRVTHTEYIGDVISSSTANTFQNTSYNLNPGNPILFPWLQQMAANFDQWKPNGIVVCFKSTSSSYAGSGTQALGGIIIASDYDVTDPSFSSKVEMENSQFAVSTKSDTNIIHAIECNTKERQVELLKCRGVGVPSDNLQWYDLCNLQIATFGVPGTSVNLGELWISYDITFYKEQVYGGLRGNSVYFSTFSGTTGVSTSYYLGTDVVAHIANTLACTWNGTTTLTFPSYIAAGMYRITYYLNGSSTAITLPTFTATNLTKTNYNVTSGTSLGAFQTSTGTTTAILIYSAYYLVTGPSATLALSSGTLPTSSTIAVLSVEQVNPSVVNL